MWGHESAIIIGFEVYPSEALIFISSTPKTSPHNHTTTSKTPICPFHYLYPHKILIHPLTYHATILVPTQTDKEYKL